ncbi:Eukaryotic translation initiation factor 4B [Malassezia furfur]|uniref:Eukaryotic translation initiation factor 4B n=1 Tax=Malassezia furfur TaxID=55194 RepID=A0ABY8ERB5_MALFU|nr:Eukaryotic translation initiation factor 4B [Malassezia furfur]
MSLVDFLADETTGSSWADEMDELPSAPAPRDQMSGFGSGGLGSRPMGRSRFEDHGAPFAREEPPLPTEPPFTAFVVNLSFESTESDVQYFFEPLKPLSVRLVSSHDGRPKGYGYVEFETLDQLKEALTYTGRPLDNRNVRVSVAEPSSRGLKSTMADDASQWRRSTPLPSSNRGGFGDFGSGSGFDEMGVGADGSRSGFGGKFTPSADRPPRRSMEPMEPSRSDTASDWRTGKPVTGRNNTSRFGFGSADGERRGGGFERREPGASEEGFANWRAGRLSSGGSQGSTERRKLDLKPRGSTPSGTPTSPSQGSARSNPFGAAKPVDVGQREREIDEKIRVQDRLRREERQKHEEKKARAPKAKTEGAWRSAAPSASAEKSNDVATENDSEWKTV